MQFTQNSIVKLYFKLDYSLLSNKPMSLENITSLKLCANNASTIPAANMRVLLGMRSLPSGQTADAQAIQRMRTNCQK